MTGFTLHKYTCLIISTFSVTFLLPVVRQLMYCKRRVMLSCSSKAKLLYIDIYKELLWKWFLHGFLRDSNMRCTKICSGKAYPVFLDGCLIFCAADLRVLIHICFTSGCREAIAFDNIFMGQWSRCRSRDFVN